MYGKWDVYLEYAGIEFSKVSDGDCFGSAHGTQVVVQKRAMVVFLPAKSSDDLFVSFGAKSD